MKKNVPYLLAVILAGFGLLTLFLSTSVIFDLFDIRAKEGNYVLFVVWSNFISSILYLIAAYGILKGKKWTTTPLGISTIVLIAAFIGLKILVNSGGIYETKTVSAMIFRISVTLLFTIIAYFTISKKGNMKVITISLIAISLSFFSCGNNANDNPNKQTEAVVKEQHQHNDEDIALNSGQKWKLDANMITYIRNMENDVNTLEAKSANDYAALSKNLESNIELLTTNCTMKGQAHDELHKWLIPFIDLSDEFSASKTEQESAVVYQKIKTAFNSFNIYFE
ncbi:MAG: DMT family transporter [Bacteroidota bacterium]|nr:DMT family transporter [Bacteroidota bacterium]